MRGSHNERQKEEQQHLCWQQGKKNQEIEKSPFGGAGVPAGGMQLIAQKQEPDDEMQVCCCSLHTQESDTGMW